MPKLVLVRHGQSTWNEKNLFTGWVDVPLSDDVGVREARRAGELIKEAGLEFDVVHTSLLTRAIQTANLALHECNQLWVPVKRSWRLNERHYGDLQGKNKAEALEKLGQEKFMEARRSYNIPPVEISPDNEHTGLDRRYSHLNPEVLPKTESLLIVIDRLLPYWDDEISLDLLSGKTVMIAAHGNSLRGLVKHLDGISDDAIANLNIPTGIPLVYELKDDLTPAKPAYYLDPEAAEAGAKAVANQGNKK